MAQTKVFWSPWVGEAEAISFQDTLYFEPEPLLKHIVSNRDKNVRYLKCPAFKDYVKNTFVIKSPLDLDVEFFDNGDIKTYHYNQKFFDKFIRSRATENNTFPMMTIEHAGIMSYSDKPVVVEQLAPNMSLHAAEFLRHLQLIPGTFDISKWYRPLTFTFEMVKPMRISIKRGDPLYYVRYVTSDDSIVKLERVDLKEDLLYTINHCLALKDFTPGNKMNDNYTIAQKLIQRFRKKSKCPFSGWWK